MSWSKKVNLERLKKKAEKVVVTDVERAVDDIRDRILIEAQKVGGWGNYIFNRQKGLRFTTPNITIQQKPAL